MIVILSQIPTFLCTNNNEYTNCTQEFQCANFPNISYPFWGGNRPDYCGHPNFRLDCRGDAPRITIQSAYRVLAIDTTTRTLTVVREEFWNNTCPTQFQNTTLDTAHFTYLSDSQNLTLYYGCQRILASQTAIPGQLNCSADGTNNTISFATTSVTSSTNINISTCQTNVIVPVNQIEAVAFAINSINVRQVIRSGVGLKWDANNTVCDQCVQSNGTCGSNSSSSGSFLCYCPDHRSHKISCNTSQSQTKKISFTITCLITIIFCLKRRFASSANVLAFWKKESADDQNVEAFIRNHRSLSPKRYRYSDINKITNSFKDKLGQGGYGSAYKGELSDGRLVAVKVLSQTEGNGQEFINEVASISRTSHVNIVNLLGFCFEAKRRALIYEFMAKGSLDKFICNDKSASTNCRLEWRILYQIALGIARGLEYLHRGCSTRIVHFDIKPHNILLDEDLRPKISDFGLAKLCQTKQSVISMLGARGTAGYIAPEVFSRTFGQVSHKSDVYSYGMMVLEMTGARDQKVGVVQTSEKYFPHWIYEHLEHYKYLRLHDIVTTKEEEETVRKMILVGLWCIQTSPSDRPPMSKVVEMLEGSLLSLQIPPKPYLFAPTRADPSAQDPSHSLGTTTMVEEMSEGRLQSMQISPLSSFLLEQYTNCSQAFQFRRFSLNCTGDAPLITIQTRPYRVLTINDSTQILKVVREEFWENICPTQFVNATVDNTPFTYISPQDLMLYYGCFPSLITASNMTTVTSCHKVVSVQVDQTEAAAFASSLTSNSTSVNVTHVLDSGVELQWDANNSICDQCIGSGGKCGSNTSSGLFACYCLDKPYAFTCNTNQSGTAKKECVDDRNVEAFIRNYGSLTPKQYRYSDLKKITSSFKDKLRQGGYGSVYKGKLSDGRLVAVKVLSQTEGNGQEFINEVASISRTSHVNVVNLLGFCFETKTRALIYEFIANGLLDKFICNDESVNTNCRLEWSTLYQIAVGIARGLEYLHRGCSTRISIISMFGARGTVGYIALEVFSKTFGQVSHKSDVYSYGMMVLEMTGARDQKVVVQTSEKYFPHWIYEHLEHEKDLRLHGVVTTTEEEETVRKMILVGLWCIQSNPSDRPPMSKVVEMLEGNLQSLQIPPKPYLFPPTRANPSTQKTSNSLWTMNMVEETPEDGLQY
ncbi:unnamed protein product [Camellia sinensis]